MSSVEPGRPGFGPVAEAEVSGLTRRWWDAEAEAYYAEHGQFLGDRRLRWCPEGLDEDDCHLLGDVAGQRVLEVGCGGGQGTRWARDQGAEAVGVDISGGMLAVARAIDGPDGLIQADARALPFGDDAFDLAFSAFGALPFVPDVEAVHGQVGRVLRPGGRWVFAVVHPLRWAFPDDAGRRGLTAIRSYFDRAPYREQDEAGRVVYAEFHHTLGDHIRALRRAGFVLDDLIEPEWPPGQNQTWGAWGPIRGAILPGTAIFLTHLATGSL